jgi:hypothetical protein
MYVFERTTGEIFYEHTTIPPKRVREKKRGESILVSDAVKVARFAVTRDKKQIGQESITRHVTLNQQTNQ